MELRTITIELVIPVDTVVLMISAMDTNGDELAEIVWEVD